MTNDMPLPEPTDLGEYYDGSVIWGYTTTQINDRDAQWQAKVEALQSERNMYKATAEAVVCMHCDAERDALRQQLEVARKNLPMFVELMNEAASVLGQMTIEQSDQLGVRSYLQDELHGAALIALAATKGTP